MCLFRDFAEDSGPGDPGQMLPGNVAEVRGRTVSFGDWINLLEQLVELRLLDD